MSYDLTMFAKPADGDIRQAYQQIIEREEIDLTDGRDQQEALSETARVEMRRLVDALKAQHSKFREFQPVSQVKWIELDEDDLEIQIHIYEQTVSVTMPYFRERAPEMMQCVTGVIGTLNAVAGYVAFDPQLDRAVSPTDLEDMVTQYRYMDKMRPGIVVRERRKPWWKVW